MKPERREKKSRTRLRPVLLAAAAVVLLGVLWFLVVRPGADPARRMGKLWTGLGVDKPNVILMTLDTTRADHLACYGWPYIRTPNLDALAARGVLFEQAATVAPLIAPISTSITVIPIWIVAKKRSGSSLSFRKICAFLFPLSANSLMWLFLAVTTAISVPAR